MKIKKLALVSVASLAAIGLSMGATSASAAVWNGGDVSWSSGGTWDLSQNSFNFGGPFSDAWAATIDNGVFDDGLTIWAPDDSTELQCPVADLSPAADASGDQILTCDPEDMPIGPNDELMAVSMEMRFFADNQTVRQIITVKNTTGAAVSGAEILSYNNFFQDSYTNLEYSNTLGSMIANWPTGNSDAADVLTEADNIFVTDCPTDSNVCDPSYTGANVMQVNGPDGQIRSTFFDTATYPPIGGDAANSNAFDEAYFSWVLPNLAVDQEVSVVIMNRTYLFLQGADDTATGVNALAASQAAVAFAEAGGWTTDQVMVGITDPSKVVNYSGAATPSLPDTGLDTAPLAVGAGVLMLAGIGLVVALRRRARA